MLVTRLLASALASAVLLAGCSSAADPEADQPPAEGDAPVVQLGAPGEDNRTLSPEEQQEIQDPAHTDADVEFVRGMIHHHQQALEMTAMVDDRAATRDVRLLAERIDVSQESEIEQMRTWLEERGEDPGDTGEHGSDHGMGHGDHGSGHGDMLMPGMLTKAQLDRLERAEGRQFDRLFLLSMIQHHEGAIAMVSELLASGEGGQESAVFQIAQHVESDQQVEISRMKSLLAG